MRVGPYVLGSPIGSGATGIVYDAWRDDLQRRVAVKQLHPQLAARQDFVERFRAEARVMASLSDPNCVRVIDLLELPTGVFLVTERVDGPSLQGLLAERGRLDARQLSQVVRGALLGLGHAHERGLVHCDVKPANILVDRAGTSKLTDFGQAIDTGTIQALGATPLYVSPELVTGRPLDRRADIYSFGAVLYEALEGRPPFIADSAAAVLNLHVTTPPPEPRAAPSSLRPLLLRTLSKDPAERPTDVPAMLLELEARGAEAFGPAWFTRALWTAAGAAAGVAAGLSAGAAAAGGGAVDLGAPTVVAGAPPVPPPPAPPGAQPPLSWAPPADPRVRVLEAASRGGAVRAVASLAGALAVLAGGLGVARSGAGSLTSAPATLRIQVDGSGTATSPGPRSSGSCGTVDLAFTFTVRGSASEVAEVAGKAFVALITATAPASPLDGRLVSTPIDSAGRAALTFAGAAVPPGGASWSARPVRLGELPVDEAATHAVTVTATCTLT